MPVTNYDTVSGLLLGETTGSSRADYMTDALRSVVGTTGAAGAPRNFYRYKPYGDTLIRDGADADPRFLWTGESGSRNSGAKYAGQYNRARHYGREQASWTSVDPLWPDEAAYLYVRANPTTWTDPDGLQTTGLCIPPPVPPPGPFSCTKAWNAFIFGYCNCYRNNPSSCDAMARAYYNLCKGRPGPGPFGPPAGGPGEIAPRPGRTLPPPRPKPNFPTCITSRPKETGDCLKLMADYIRNNVDPAGHPDIAGAQRTCHDCCRMVEWEDDCDQKCNEVSVVDLGLSIYGVITAAGRPSWRDNVPEYFPRPID